MAKLVFAPGSCTRRSSEFSSCFPSVRAAGRRLGSLEQPSTLSISWSPSFVDNAIRFTCMWSCCKFCRVILIQTWCRFNLTLVCCEPCSHSSIKMSENSGQALLHESVDPRPLHHQHSSLRKYTAACRWVALSEILAAKTELLSHPRLGSAYNNSSQISRVSDKLAQPDSYCSLSQTRTHGEEAFKKLRMVWNSSLPRKPKSACTTTPLYPFFFMD